MKGSRIRYLPEELAWIAAHYRDRSRADLHSGFCCRFGRKDVSLDNICGLCKRKGWAGPNGVFQKGHVSANKGKKMPFNPNTAANWFRKGHLPHNTRYLGHERVNTGGYVEISVAETNPHTGYARRYVAKHRHLWEAAHGPLPEGMVLKCLDGDKTNCDPANWQAMPKALLSRLNGRFGRGYDAAPAEVRPVILATCKLEHMAREIRKGRG